MDSTNVKSRPGNGRNGHGAKSATSKATVLVRERELDEAARDAERNAALTWEATSKVIDVASDLGVFKNR